MNILPAALPEWGNNYDLGWIGFVRHRAFISDGIAWLTRHWRHPLSGGAMEPSISHVLIVSGPGMCIEANGDGVDEDSIEPYFSRPDKCVIYFRRPRGWTLNMGGRIVTEARKYKGEKYGYDLIVADAVSYSLVGHLVNGLTGDALDRFVTSMGDSPATMICDKLAAVAMQAQPELARLGTLREPARCNNPQKLFSDEDVFEADVTLIQTIKASAL